MKHATRPAIFKWRETAPELILCALRWYLRYSLSLRDVEELFAERGLEVDHTTIWRWVQRYGPELEKRLRRHLKPTNKSWRVDETYIRVQGSWCYLYRTIDSTGATIDFLLSALRDAAAAKRLFRKALSDPSHPQPRVINTDKARLYGSAIAAVKEEGTLRRRCRHRPVQYLNNILEQDHRAIKRRVKAKQGFRAFKAAERTIAGYEAMHMIRKGQARCVRVDVCRQISSSTICSSWRPETFCRVRRGTSFVTVSKVATLPIKDIAVVRGVPQPIYKIPLRDIPEAGFAGAIPALLSRIIIGPTEYPLALAEAFADFLAEAGIT